MRINDVVNRILRCLSSFLNFSLSLMKMKKNKKKMETKQVPVYLLRNIFTFLSFDECLRFSSDQEERESESTRENREFFPWLKLLEKVPGVGTIIVSLSKPSGLESASNTRNKPLWSSKRIDILCSKHGWLLLSIEKGGDDKTEGEPGHCLFFFNPSNGMKLQLPNLKHIIIPVGLPIAFSHPPTSPHCRVFTIHGQEKDMLHVIMSYWRPWEPAWTSRIYTCTIPVYFLRVLWFSDMFLCFDAFSTLLASFNVEHEEACFNNACGPWTGTSSHEYEKLCRHGNLGRNMDMEVEYNGIIYRVRKIDDMLFRVSKLNIFNDIEHYSWEDVDDLGDLTLFVSRTGSMARKTSHMQNEVWIVDYHACYRFDVKSRQLLGFHPYLRHADSNAAIWIEPIMD